VHGTVLNTSLPYLHMDTIYKSPSS